MRSMTGFGQSAGENETHRVAVSVRTVNHRFLDMVLRLPEALREREKWVRDRLSTGLERGRVELRLTIETLGVAKLTVEVRDGLARQIHQAVKELAEQGLVRAELDPGDLLRLPEVLSVTQAQTDWTDHDEVLLVEMVDEALAQVVAARVAEGGRLTRVLDERLADMGQIVARVESLRHEVQAEQVRRLKERVANLLAGSDVAPDEERLAQEIAILAERGDVQEEIDRLEGHLEHFREIATGEGPHGKRLDFLTQEILRELNTLGAKCRGGDVVRLILEAKAVCEQIREQVQNIE